jgi:hypothetical protein
MIKTIVGFVAGVVLALGGSAAAGTDKPELRSSCHEWNKPNVYQCNVYMPDFDMGRVRLFEDGEYVLGVDYFPGHDRVARVR